MVRPEHLNHALSLVVAAAQADVVETFVLLAIEERFYDDDNVAGLDEADDEV